MSLYFKLKAPFERIIHTTDNPEKSLLIAIIQQAIFDASAISDKPAYKREASKARLWLFQNNEDFKEYCSCLGLDYRYVRHISRQLVMLNKQRYLEKAREKAKKIKFAKSYQSKNDKTTKPFVFLSRHKASLLNAHNNILRQKDVIDIKFKIEA